MTPVYLDNNATTRTDPRGGRGDAALLHRAVRQCLVDARLRRRGGQALASRRASSCRRCSARRSTMRSSTPRAAPSRTTARSCPRWKRRPGATRSSPRRSSIRPCSACVAHLEKTRGVKVHIIGVDRRGRLDMEAYAQALGPKTAIASVMWANNETGTIFPVEQLAELAHGAGALFHTDAVQAVGKIPIDLKDTRSTCSRYRATSCMGPRASARSMSARAYASARCFAAGIRNAAAGPAPRTRPASSGWARRPNWRWPPWTTNRPVWRAARPARTGPAPAHRSTLRHRRSRNRLPNTCNIAFEYIEGEAILLLMNRDGIAASSGSACTSGSLEPSHVLRAMNVPYTAAHGAIRFSFSRENSDADVDRVIEVMPAIIETAAGNVALLARARRAAPPRSSPPTHDGAMSHAAWPFHPSSSTTARCATASRRPAWPSPRRRSWRLPLALEAAGVDEIEAGMPAMGAAGNRSDRRHRRGDCRGPRSSPGAA